MTIRHKKFNKNFLFDGKNIRNEKDTVKENNWAEGKAKEAENLNSLSGAQEILVWVGVSGWFADGSNLPRT